MTPVSSNPAAPDDPHVMLGEALEPLLRSGFRRKIDAAAALGMRQTYLSQIFSGKKTTQAFWQVVPPGTEKTRLQILQSLPAWPGHKTSFMKAYDRLDSHQGAASARGQHQTPEARTLAAALDALLYPHFKSQRAAAAALGIKQTNLSQILLGEDHTQGFWQVVPPGMRKTRLQILRGLPAWRAHGKDFMSFFSALPVGEKTTPAPWRKATSEVFRRIIRINAPEPKNISEEISVLKKESTSRIFIENLDAVLKGEPRSVAIYRRVGKSLILFYHLHENYPHEFKDEPSQPAPGEKPAVARLRAACRLLGLLMPELRRMVV